MRYDPNHAVSRELSRRGFLTIGGAAGAAALAGLLSACSTPVVSGLTGSAPTSADVVFWHLFGGGDGANMTTMVGDVQRADHLSVESTLLSWGNPYYTKLSLAASSGNPPDVAISHLSRLPLLARAGLLRPIEDLGVDDVGIVQQNFTPAAWSKATVAGTTYAVPLDTHPFVLFYNVDLARKAGLLDKSGRNLEAINGKDDFIAALKAMKQATGHFGAVASITADPATNWRLFYMLYSGLAGPIVSDQGTKLTLDRDALEETFAFLSSLSNELKLMPSNSTATTASTLFGSGQAGFLFDGEWQIPTYRDLKLPDGKPLNFNVVPFPAILGPKATAYADSHSLVFPKASSPSAKRTRDAVTFVRGLLDRSTIWAGGGHVPAWLPVQKSAAFRKLEPQSNYVQAAFDAVYDPPGWYTGAGSDFQIRTGGVVSDVLAGGLSPSAAVGSMADALKTFTTATPPVR